MSGALGSLARLRPHHWPVRWRLAGVSAGLTLAILILFGAIIGSMATKRVRDDFNSEMERAVSTLASQIQIADTLTNTWISREPDLGDFVSSNEATVRIFDSQGIQLDASPDAADMGPPAPGIQEHNGMRIVTVTLRSGQTGRIAGFVQYGRSEEHVDSTIGKIWFFIVAGILVATLLACLAGLAIARRAMRPISSLTATAREIAATGDPSRHMPTPQGEDEVAELAETLEQMLRSLDSARAEREGVMKRQREFVADASHELRTPLTSILANLELLQGALEDPSSAEERGMVDSALRSSQRMSRLVADLLLLARADAGRIGARTDCDLAQIAGEAAAEVAPTLGDRTLTVDNERPLPVVGNPDELHRMVLNLLDNAARHTPPGAQIELRLRPDGRAAVVEVGDDGPGIPPEQREALFERFVRGDGPADTAVSGGSSGLGLAIVKAVASSHAGTVEVGESPLGGALFRIRMPLSRADREIIPALDRL